MRESLTLIICIYVSCVLLVFVYYHRLGTVGKHSNKETGLNVILCNYLLTCGSHDLFILFVV